MVMTDRLRRISSVASDFCVNQSTVSTWIKQMIVVAVDIGIEGKSWRVVDRSFVAQGVFEVQLPHQKHLTLAEVAEFLDASHKHIRNLIATKQIEAYRVTSATRHNSKIRISNQSLRRFVEGRINTTTPNHDGRMTACRSLRRGSTSMGQTLDLSQQDLES